MDEKTDVALERIDEMLEKLSVNAVFGQPFKEGDLVYLVCLDEKAGKDGKLYLGNNGRNGATSLTSQAGTRFIATKRKVAKVEGSLGLECQVGGLHHRWLEGLPKTSTVQTAVNTGGRFVGTKWKLHDRGDGKFQLECLADPNGGYWLEGAMKGGTLQLSKDNKLPGTFWKISKVQ